MRTSTNVKKVTLFKAAFLLLFILNFNLGFGQCNAELKVNQNRNNRSVSPAGTYYSMEITNNGRTVDTYILSKSDVNRSSSNPDGSTTVGNVVLNVEFLDKGLKPISEIKVNPGQTVTFFSHILVPGGTPLNKWSSTQITAKSKICSNYKVDTVLHTLTIDPKENN